jgi:hypothetical protein
MSPSLTERERELALSVLHQALTDACLPWRALKDGKEPILGSDYVSNKDIAEACAFWADEKSNWAGARRAWCDAAGVDPEWARKKALAKIAIARGGCITRFASWRVRLLSAREERRLLADLVFEAFDTGEPAAKIMARMAFDLKEFKRLLELGRARKKRNSPVEIARAPSRESLTA